MNLSTEKNIITQTMNRFDLNWFRIILEQLYVLKLDASIRKSIELDIFSGNLSNPNCNSPQLIRLFTPRSITCIVCKSQQMI